MNAQRILAVFSKEWTLVFKSASAWLAILTPQAAVTALLLYILHALTVMRGAELPDWVMDYFLMFFVAMPALNATMIAAGGIMADKAAKSLEPLLATPLTPMELISGKLSLAVLPTFCTTVIAFETFVHVARSWNLTQSHLLGNIGGAFCFGVILTMTLLLANLVALNGFLIASRKTETRSATLASTTAAETILLVPMLGVFCGYKYHVPGATWALLAIGILLLANVILFLLGLKLFQRETILFKWK